MPKTPSSRFVCQNCGAQSLRWLGRCPTCESWHSLVEETVEPPTGGSAPPPPSLPTLADVAGEKTAERTVTGLAEFDRVWQDKVKREREVVEIIQNM